MAILMQKPGNSGRMIYVLWAITIAAILYVLIAGFVNFDGDNFQLPPEPLRNGIATLGAACRFGIYDFTGYYDVCTMGGEVQKPRRTIPGSCIITCSVLLCVYMLTYISILGYLPWGGDDGFATRAANDDAVYIVAEVPSMRPNPALHPHLAQCTPSPRTISTLSHISSPSCAFGSACRSFRRSSPAARLRASPPSLSASSSSVLCSRTWPA